MIYFTIDGHLYVVPDGATWTTVMSMYNALNLIVDRDHILIGEHYIKYADGTYVKYTDTVDEYGAYLAYPHSYDAQGVCTACGHECRHWYYVNGKCATCGALCAHAAVTDGKCDRCGEDVE